MTALDYTRQRDWFDPNKVNARVTIVGCGGIGSFAAFALAKLGVQQLTLLDFDTVEEHNLPNQMFAESQLGEAKVSALQRTIRQYAPGGEVSLIEEQLQAGVPLAPVVISALDSMTARAELWHRVRMKPQVKLFLDARLGGEHVVLYAVKPTLPSEIRGYEATLHSDEEGLELPCTARSIIDVGFAVGSLITRAVRRHYTNQEVERVVYLNQQNLTIHKGGYEL